MAALASWGEVVNVESALEVESYRYYVVQDQVFSIELVAADVASIRRFDPSEALHGRPDPDASSEGRW
jgi:hypothetical protein